MRSRTLCTLVVCLVLAGACPAAQAAEKPFFVDLSRVANADLEDDGIRDNGAGGWTDEGINDMFLWPPLPLGTNLYNGYPFHVIDPAENDGRSVLILRGRRRCQDKPVRAEVPVPEVRGRYVFFMQNAAAQTQVGSNFRVATYSVRYADGTQTEIPIRDDLEIRQWWIGGGENNHRRELRWPVHYGRNIYTRKWNAKIGVWATRWVNPHPEKPISALEFRSEVRSVPIIFAVTIADRDYAAERQPPPEAGPIPEGYFARKAALENGRLFDLMLEEGHARGVRNIELIRRDLLAVTVDPALTRTGIGMGDAGQHQKPEAFTISSETDSRYADGRHPTEVGRLSYERWNGDIGPFPGNILYWHEFYLRLPEPLRSGHDYTLHVEGIEPPLKAETPLSYHEERTITKAIKVNQVGYSARAGRRYAYLGWWAGDLGAVDYSGLERFAVLDEQTGRTVLEGPITLRREGDALSGEDVYEMSISELGPGRYHIRIPGLGRSDSFAVGGEALRELHFHTMRAFFHQRCGQRLGEPWTWVQKEPCHVWCWESGYLLTEDYEPKPGEEKRAFRGGYHDAADFDHFTYHLKGTAQTLSMYEQFPEAFADGALNLPESGNGIPDVLDEAHWALFFYRDHQRPDGGVPLGRGNGCDAFAQQTGGKRTPFGVLPVKNTSCTEFAAVAAQYARIIEPFDPERAASYLGAARRAYDWARQHPDDSDRARRLAAWAAAELFRATGEQPYNERFKALHREGALRARHRILSQHAGVYWWPYIVCERDGTDRQVQQELGRMLIEKADALVASLERPAYRMSHGGETYLGWGSGNGGGYYADALLRAYWLTGEQKYLDATCLNADFQLGCNPLSKSFITSMGARYPVRPEISRFLYEGPGASGRTVEGITVYGLSEQVEFDWYPRPVPAWRKWRDLWGAGSETCSEFTIAQTIGPSAMLYGSLYAMGR
ncbi:MAG: glycoside hydrolase family 9 protein [Candidatus Brocadiia bacterium]